MWPVGVGDAHRFKPALNSKGLRRVFDNVSFYLFRFKPALNSKGLRRLNAFALREREQLQASPEFKGIKTIQHAPLIQRLRFKPALNSKGLRHL